MTRSSASSYNALFLLSLALTLVLALRLADGAHSRLKQFHAHFISSHRIPCQPSLDLNTVKPPRPRPRVRLHLIVEHNLNLEHACHWFRRTDQVELMLNARAVH